MHPRLGGTGILVWRLCFDELMARLLLDLLLQIREGKQYGATNVLQLRAMGFGMHFTFELNFGQPSRMPVV